MNNLSSNVIAPEGCKKLVIHNICNFVKLDLPLREYIVYPIIPTQGLVMIYAHRGVGKTFLGLSIA